MRTVEWPERTRFLARIDELMRRENFRHDSALAEAAGISHTALSNWRKGKVKPSLVSVAAVAKALDTKPNDLAAVAGLLNDTGEFAGPEPLPDDIEKLGAYYRMMDDDGRIELLKYVRVVLSHVEHEMLPGRPQQRRAS